MLDKTVANWWDWWDEIMRCSSKPIPIIRSEVSKDDLNKDFQRIIASVILYFAPSLSFIPGYTSCMHFLSYWRRHRLMGLGRQNTYYPLYSLPHIWTCAISSLMSHLDLTSTILLSHPTWHRQNPFSSYLPQTSLAWIFSDNGFVSKSYRKKWLKTNEAVKLDQIMV